MHGGHLWLVYAMIKAFIPIIYHVMLQRAKDSDQFISWKCNGLMLRDQNLGSSEARGPAKFTTVVRKDENVAVRGSHMKL